MEYCNNCGKSWQYWKDGYADLDCCPDWMCNECMFYMINECVDDERDVKCRCGEPLEVEWVKYLIAGDERRLTIYENFLSQSRSNSDRGG